MPTSGEGAAGQICPEVRGCADAESGRVHVGGGMDGRVQLR